METFLRLFGSLLVFVYHCFDRIVIFGYLPLLSRPEQIVYFFRSAAGSAVATKELSLLRLGPQPLLSWQPPSAWCCPSGLCHRR